MKKSISIIVLLLLMNSFVAGNMYAGDKKKVVHIFILAGQSNAVGFNEAATYKAGKDSFDMRFLNHSRVLFWPGTNAVKGVAGRWIALQTGASNMPGWPYKNAFGPEIGFAHTIQTLMPGEDIAILKYAVGGTGIARSSDYHDYIPSLKGFDDKGQNWHFPEPGKQTGELYIQFMNNIRNGMDSLKKIYRHCRIRGLIWMQGEHEAGISKTMAGDYAILLAGFIQSIRKDLQIKHLPVVIGQVNLNTWAFGDLARQRQMEYSATDPYSKLIQTTDLPRNGNGDTAHFDAEGMLLLGERFAEEMLQLLKAREK
ncbi:MAG: sialate O-acetylesterase [Agriterribacter sp.]